MNREARRALIAAAAAIGLTMTPAEAARLVEPAGYAELRQLVEAHPEISKAITPGLSGAPLLMGRKKSGLKVQDVFNISLWAGTSGANEIITSIDNSFGSMVWIKNRTAASQHVIFDTIRGASVYFWLNSTNAESTNVATLSAFLSDGYTLGNNAQVNNSIYNYVGWQWRRAEGFFDVVAYSGNGLSGREIPHSLGIKPGLIIVKSRTVTQSAYAYHRSVGATQPALVSSGAGFVSNSTIWADTEPTSTHFTVGSAHPVNSSGNTYIAYLFAHDDASDGLIKCGSYVGNGNALAGPVIEIGWEPQYLLVKRVDTADHWTVIDQTRGFGVGNDARLFPNDTAAESSFELAEPTPTGFQVKTASTTFNATGNTYVYMAIRKAA